MSRNLEWLNQNSYRSYPFRSDQELIFTFGSASYKLPTDMFLDMLVIYTRNHYQLVPSGGTESLIETLYNYRVGTIKVGLTVTVTILADTNISTVETIGTFEFQRIQERQEATFIGGSGVCIAQNLQELPIGTWECDTAYLDMRIVRVNPFGRAVGLLVNDCLLIGNVTLSEGYNIQLSRDGGTISFSAGLGYGAGEYCPTACPEPTFCNTALQGVNGVPADANGNLLILGENMVTVSNDPSGHGIIIGTDINVDNLCERPGGTVGDQGPTGPRGPQGPQGIPATPEICQNRDCGGGSPPTTPDGGGGGGGEVADGYAPPTPVLTPGGEPSDKTPPPELSTTLKICCLREKETDSRMAATNPLETGEVEETFVGSIV